MEEKKIFEKPEIRVFELQQQPQLLVGSGLSDPADYPGGQPDPFA
jgi:hypothetical protein